MRDNGKAANEVELYEKGEKRVIRNLRITKEPQDEHFTEAQRELNTRAYYLAQDGDTEKAIVLWEQYLQEHEDEPSVLNNLARTYGQAGRITERDALIKKLGKQFPDYFFYKIIQASECITAADFKQARTILDSIGGKDEYHVSKMKALCDLNINYYLKKKDYLGVVEWYKKASICLPDDPDFSDPETIGSIELMERLKSCMGEWS